MIYLKTNIEIDLNLFEQNRPDLWPMLDQEIKTNSKDIFELKENNKTVNFLKEKYDARLLIQIKDLSEQGQIIVIKAVKQKQNRNLAIMRPAHFKEKRPDLWGQFIEYLKESNETMYLQTHDEQINEMKWFVDDLPPKAASIIIKATLEARQKLNQGNQ